MPTVLTMHVCSFDKVAFTNFTLNSVQLNHNFDPWLYAADWSKQRKFMNKCQLIYHAATYGMGTLSNTGCLSVCLLRVVCT